MRISPKAAGPRPPGEIQLGPFLSVPRLAEWRRSSCGGAFAIHLSARSFEAEQRPDSGHALIRNASIAGTEPR